MVHYCPKCKVMSKAISREKGFLTVGGRNIIAVNDITTCGARFLHANQHLVVRESGVAKGRISTAEAAVSQFINAKTAEVFDEQIVTEFEFAEGMPYFIRTGDGQVYQGVIDADGKLPPHQYQRKK